MEAQDKYNAPFPSNLRALLDERKSTITALARELGITRQAVSQYADGTGQPNADKLKRIANYFDVSTDWLLGRAGGIKSLNADVSTVGKYTGLSEAAIEFLHSICDQEKQLEAISAIISHGAFSNIVGYVLELKDAKIESEFDRWGISEQKAERTTDGGRIIRGFEHEIFLEYMIETCMKVIVGEITQDMISKEYPIE